jgi:hypothetical protein
MRPARLRLREEHRRLDLAGRLPGLERWELKSVLLAQAKAEFDMRRWLTDGVDPTAFQILEDDTILLRRRVHGRNNYGPWTQA